MSPRPDEASLSPPADNDRVLRPAGGLALAVLDLDGTLVDTAPDLTAGLNHCLATVGLPPVALEVVRPHAGMGVRFMLQRAYDDAGRSLDADEMDAQAARFIAYYEAHIADRSTLFPGALEALDRLEEGGYALAICTNKLEALARSLLAALGLIDRFAAICGADTFAGRKPDPVHLRGTIARAGGDPSHSVMIGDSHVDIDAALACEIPSVLVGFGYGADAATRDRAGVTVSSFDEIDAGLLTELLDRRHRAG